MSEQKPEGKGRFECMDCIETEWWPLQTKEIASVKNPPCVSALGRSEEH